jgi:hypothetical protein
MASRVRQFLGLKVFYMLYVPDQKKEINSVERFIRIAELLLEIGNMRSI